MPHFEAPLSKFASLAALLAILQLHFNTCLKGSAYKQTWICICIFTLIRRLRSAAFGRVRSTNERARQAICSFKMHRWLGNPYTSGALGTESCINYGNVRAWKPTPNANDSSAFFPKEIGLQEVSKEMHRKWTNMERRMRRTQASRRGCFRKKAKIATKSG